MLKSSEGDGPSERVAPRSCGPRHNLPAVGDENRLLAKFVS